MAATILNGNPNPSFFQSRGLNRSRGSHGRPSDRGHFQRRDRSTAPRVPAENLVMGQVKILKRGEPLTAFLGNRGSEVPGESRDPDLGLGSTSRLGPDPVTVQNQLRFSDPPLVYGGNGVYVKSPPPSSVPVPCFLQKAGTASSELRRLLRLHAA
ncbi:uncharacterized protein LOC116199370 [Punica granatum]|uniref:Uncharacterized protein n=2 Tax=Punica granatum TaxID=22663 RepID=A0A218W009_PUNGR|nr:uncharacterized protein LOC116199370 [Punica granatum]OWM65798.1 hypothetical protein CDL15_Pgr015223 [Punica granatum]PKI52307.1 hypothetical protein CRG98_027233 [Punica granatum]